MKDSEKHLDSILSEVGEFGKYQQRILMLFSLIIGLMFFSNIIFIFEAKPVNHRCLIPGCENETSSYLSSWLDNAVPFKDDKPERCLRYQRRSNDSFSCGMSDFNRTVVEQCHGFVYETAEISIMHDFDLHCDENLKKLTFVGTINGIGKFIGLPLAGYVSDKYGRKRTLVWSMVISGIFGLLRSYSKSYNVFIALQFFDSFFVSGAYASVYVLAAELVGPKKRVLAITFLNLSFGVGSILLAGLVWVLQSWRLFLRIVYGLYLLGLICNWLVPESLRWLLTHKKEEQIKIILRRMATVNGKSISYSSLRKLTENVTDHTETSYPIKDLLKSYILLIRCIFCCFCWISCIFSYYGLSVTSVTLSGNTYLDFILSCLIEVPACLTTFFAVERIGRRRTLSCGFLITSISSLIIIFLPKDIYYLNLTMFLIGKFGASIIMYTIYMMTSEMFPTSLRQTLLAVCSMFGRIGNIAVPQLLILKELWKPLPFLLFAVSTGISAALSITFPETSNVILPDTIEEAENIGKKKIKYIVDIDL